jgi:hypothetical protein
MEVNCQLRAPDVLSKGNILQYPGVRVGLKASLDAMANCIDLMPLLEMSPNFSGSNRKLCISCE